MDHSELEPTGGMSRRTVLKLGVLGAAGLAFSKLDRVWAQPAKPAVSPAKAPLAKAKAIIQVWLWGGPSHLDMFDPKPDAGYDYTGPLKSPIATNVDGIRIGELLPLLAQQADKYSLLRSMTHGNNGHETAAYMVQTGREPGRVVFPCAGAVVSLFKGYDHGYKGITSPYVVLTQPQGRFSESGFLGQRYKPFATGGDPNAQRFVVEGVVSERVSDQRQTARRELLHQLDTMGQAMPEQPQLLRHDAAEKSAYDLMLGKAKSLFNLAEEKQEMRERYGRTTFGQSCLMARRLVESGVPYVTINYQGWDTHKQHFEIMRRKLPEFDKGLSALLTDLSERGLLDSTIVWCSGEFGRTPRVQWEAPWNGGRGHYGPCFSALVAGGGFKGGRVVGSSDAKGEQVATRPIYPLDLIGSMYELMGIDPEAPLPNPRGMDVTLLPDAKEGAKSGGRLKEIM